MTTPRAVVLGSALPAVVLITLIAVPAARSAVGADSRESSASAGRGSGPSPSSMNVVPTGAATVSLDERRAMTMLRQSVRVGASLGFSGTQIVTAWHGASTTSEMLDLSQRSGGGRTVRVRDVADGTRGEQRITQPPVADGSVGPANRALDALSAAYDLRVSGSEEIAGRRAVEVVASRGGHVAARIWLDDGTGLQLRQDVLDDDGRMLRMSAFLELRVGAR